MNAKKPAQILQFTVASFAELRRLNAQEQVRRLEKLRRLADAAKPVVRATLVSVAPFRPVAIAVMTMADVQPGYGIRGK